MKVTTYIERTYHCQRPGPHFSCSRSNSPSGSKHRGSLGHLFLLVLYTFQRLGEDVRVLVKGVDDGEPSSETEPALNKFGGGTYLLWTFQVKPVPI
jgi:hypothetical protein